MFACFWCCGLSQGDWPLEGVSGLVAQMEQTKARAHTELQAFAGEAGRGSRLSEVMGGKWD